MIWRKESLIPITLLVAGLIVSSCSSSAASGQTQVAAPEPTTDADSLSSLGNGKLLDFTSNENKIEIAGSASGSKPSDPRVTSPDQNGETSASSDVGTETSSRTSVETNKAPVTPYRPSTTSAAGGRLSGPSVVPFRLPATSIISPVESSSTSPSSEQDSTDTAVATAASVASAIQTQPETPVADSVTSGTVDAQVTTVTRPTTTTTTAPVATAAVSTTQAIPSTTVTTSVVTTATTAASTTAVEEGKGKRRGRAGRKKIWPIAELAASPFPSTEQISNCLTVPQCAVLQGSDLYGLDMQDIKTGGRITVRRDHARVAQGTWLLIHYEGKGVVAQVRGYCLESDEGEPSAETPLCGIAEEEARIVINMDANTAEALGTQSGRASWRPVS